MLFYLKLNWIVFVDILVRLRQACTPHRLTLVRKEQAVEDITTFYFQPQHPIDYAAGQYGIWFLHRWVWGKPARLFTVASAPETGHIELSTRISHSDFKQKLAQVGVGDKVTIFGPIGRFIVPKTTPERMIMVAGGIGITPFKALLETIAAQKLPIHTTLVYTARPGGHLYQGLLSGLATEAHFIEHGQLDQTLASLAKEYGQQAPFYVSGPPPFVEAMYKSLRAQGVADVKVDGFLGYKK